MEVNYYDLLEIQSTASDEVIKMAYKALVKKYHPDVYKGDLKYAEEMIQKINVAYETLSDSEKRSRYDKELKNNCNNTGTTMQEEGRETRKQAESPKSHANALEIVFGIFIYVFEMLVSIIKYLFGIVILYVVVGMFTGNLEEWNETIVYYSKAAIHIANNIDFVKKYDDGSPEQVVDEYIQAIFDGDEYTALQKIDSENLELEDMTEGIVKTFRQLQEDDVLGKMFKDMKHAEYSIDKKQENEYVITILTCDYEMIVNQIDNDILSDAYIKRQIEKDVRIEKKNLKKEVVLYMQLKNEQWYISEIQDKEDFLDALTGNLIGNIYKENMIETGR